MRELAGNIALIVAIITFLYSIVILSKPEARGGILLWVAIMLLLTSFMYSLHAGIETLGFGEELYAVSALVASLFVLFLVIVVHMVTKLLMRR